MNDYINYYSYANKNDNNNNLDPYEGFLRGNLFYNLYVPYKNYKYRQINPVSEKEYNMLMVQAYAFAAHDLELYLDVNPNDSNAIVLRNKYFDLYKSFKNQYENKYGPICLDSNLLNNKTWLWNTKVWPWEGDK